MNATTASKWKKRMRSLGGIAALYHCADGYGVTVAFAPKGRDRIIHSFETPEGGVIVAEKAVSYA